MLKKKKLPIKLKVLIRMKEKGVYKKRIKKQEIPKNRVKKLVMFLNTKKKKHLNSTQINLRGSYYLGKRVKVMIETKDIMNLKRQNSLMRRM